MSSAVGCFGQDYSEGSERLFYSDKCVDYPITGVHKNGHAFCLVNTTIALINNVR
jgi:hypothetical protein